MQHLRRLDWLLIGSFVALSFLGLATFFVLWQQSDSTRILLQLQKQALFLIAASVLIVTVSNFDYRLLRLNAWVHMVLYGFLLVILMSVLVLGSKVRGAESWFSFGVFSVEPVEFGKIIILLFFARFFSLRHIELYNIWHIVISGVYIALPTALILAQPDLGSAVVLLGLWFGILVMAGLSRTQIAVFLTLGITAGIFAWFFVLAPYQHDRVYTFIFPNRDPLGAGYQVRQSLVTIASGGLFGQAFVTPFSQSGLGFLPESTTDFAFAAYAEQFGFVGVGFLFLLFAMLVWRIAKIFLQATNNFSRVFAAGVLVWIFLQSTIHIGMNIGFLPITGLSLPFLSAGGSSLLAFALALGILESIRLHQPMMLRDPAS